MLLWASGDNKSCFLRTCKRKMIHNFPQSFYIQKHHTHAFRNLFTIYICRHIICRKYFIHNKLKLSQTVTLSLQWSAEKCLIRLLSSERPSHLFIWLYSTVSFDSTLWWVTQTEKIPSSMRLSIENSYVKWSSVTTDANRTTPIKAVLRSIRWS